MLELLISAFGAGTYVVPMMLLLKDSSHTNAARAFFVFLSMRLSNLLLKPF